MTTTQAPAAYRKFEDGAKVTAPRCVESEDGTDFNWRRRTAVVVSHTPYDPNTGRGGYYTVRFADGVEETVSERADGWNGLQAVKPAAPKGERKAPRPKVAKPDRATLPKIVAMAGKTDSGEYGNATCPHCGADGRYVWTFHCDDGTKRGAMAGCIKLFPRSPVADEHQRLLNRQAERQDKGGQLASWDQAKLAAIKQLVAGNLTEAEVLAVVRSENAKRDAWMAKRGRR